MTITEVLEVLRARYGFMVSAQSGGGAKFYLYADPGVTCGVTERRKANPLLEFGAPCRFGHFEYPPLDAGFLESGEATDLAFKRCAQVAQALEGVN